MGFFTRRSQFDLMLESAIAIAGTKVLMKTAKVGAGLAAGAVGLGAANAAVSRAKQREQG
jgi:hypothetical protein